ncbi:MAG TPA: hypothetical protein VIM89_00305 [Mucilaginibacter sp.]
MERKLLSHDVTFGKILIVVIFIVFPLLIIKTSPPWWVYIIAAIVVGQMIAFLFYLPDTIEFDDKNMYISRSGGEITVDLRDIYKIKMVAYTINRRYMWKIKYEANSLKRAARFYPDYDRVMLNEFIDLVKSKNPDTEIVYSTNTFDFDM